MWVCSKRARANDRPSNPMALMRSGWSSKALMALAKASGALGGQTKPETSGTTVSRQPGMSVVMIGVPAAAASIKLRGTPSPYVDGSTTAAARRMAASTSSGAVQPRQRTIPS